MTYEWKLDGQFKRCDICKDIIEVIAIDANQHGLSKRYKEHLKELHRQSITEKHSMGMCQCGLIHG